MNQTNNKTIAFALVLIAAGAIVYFVLGKKKASAATPTTTPAKTTVVNKIVAAYDKGLATLNDAEIKRYAQWIDRIIQILAQSRVERNSKYGQPSQEALNNADALNKLSNDNLRAVANYWKAVRSNDLVKSLDMFTDESGKLIEFSFRIKELS